MKIRLLLLAVVVPVLLWPITAQGGGDVTVTPKYAAQNASEIDARSWTPRSGSVLIGVWKVVVDAGAGTLGLSKFEVSILSTDPSIPSPSTGRISRTYGRLDRTGDTIAFEWDTNTMTPNNGVYQIFAYADGHSGNHTEARVTDLKVNNPAAPPAGLQSGLVNNVPVLTWRASPEVDVTHYSVLRSDGGGAFREIGATPSTKFEDSQAPRETLLTYKVAAVRKSPVTPNGVVGFSSDPTSGLKINMPAGSPESSAAAAAAAAARIDPFTGKAPSPKPTVIELAHKGFAEALPYQNVPSAGDVAGNRGPSAGSILSAPARLLESTVRKLPYIAAALLMVVLAMHVFRLGRRLAKPEEAPSVT